MSLDRFHTPNPRPALMRALGWVNGHVVLPHVSRVKSIRLPAEDEARLREATRAPFVLCPNHPELFTDWMLDKYLCDRHAPLAASWADTATVNGMGRAMRAFWLANGLVAAVHGPELELALSYSGQCLARGHGALIHPEGEVNWDNEALGTLRAGAVRIAEQGAAQLGRAASLIPLAWFLRFRVDATRGLQRELDYVEARLRVHTARLAGPAQRLGALYETLLERSADEFALEIGPRSDGFVTRYRRGLAHGLARLHEEWPEYRPEELPAEAAAAARAWRSAARRLPDAPPQFRRPIQVIDRFLRLVPAAVDQPTMTQEQVHERIKRLRVDWLRGALRDSLARSVPRAVAPRDVFLRVAEPVTVAGPSDHSSVLASLRSQMLAALARARQDGLDALGPTVRYANPFVA
ncbi:MAG: hypothetical protein IPJ19_20345 [Planctomycetes bacterium]|nr:hypothetical protein [Planctomycetota bacterium]